MSKEMKKVQHFGYRGSSYICDTTDIHVERKGNEVHITVGCCDPIDKDKDGGYQHVICTPHGTTRIKITAENTSPTKEL